MWDASLVRYYGYARVYVLNILNCIHKKKHRHPAIKILDEHPLWHYWRWAKQNSILSFSKWSTKVLITLNYHLPWNKNQKLNIICRLCITQHRLTSSLLYVLLMFYYRNEEYGMQMALISSLDIDTSSTFKKKYNNRNKWYINIIFCTSFHEWKKEHVYTYV